VPKRARLAVAGGGAPRRPDARTELSDADMNAAITDPSALIRPLNILRPRAPPVPPVEELVALPPAALTQVPHRRAAAWPGALGDAPAHALLTAAAAEELEVNGYDLLARTGLATPAGARARPPLRSILDVSVYDVDAYDAAAAAAAAGIAAPGPEDVYDPYAEEEQHALAAGAADDDYAAAAGDVSFAMSAGGGYGYGEAEQMRAGSERGRLSLASGAGAGAADMSFAASSDLFGAGAGAGAGERSGVPSPLLGSELAYPFDHDGVISNAPAMGGHALGPSFDLDSAAAAAAAAVAGVSASQIGPGGIELQSATDASLAGPGFDAEGRLTDAERARLARLHHAEIASRATHVFHRIIDAAFRAAAAAAPRPAPGSQPQPVVVTLDAALARAAGPAGAESLTPADVAVSFVQLLALRALGFVTLRQARAYGTISIGKGPHWAPPAAVAGSGGAAAATAAAGAAARRMAPTSAAAPSPRRSVPGPFAGAGGSVSGAARRAREPALERVSEESEGAGASSSRSQQASPVRGGGVGAGAKAKPRRHTGDFTSSESGGSPARRAARNALP
jgi:hypothetical protein